MKINKLFALSAITLICFGLSGCGQTNTDEDYGDAIVLNVYNWADYISETEGDQIGVLDQFEEYCKTELKKNVKVNYSTFETNEDLYNQLRAGGVQYDLVCPSEYMIEKMIINDMIEPLDSPIPNYDEFASKYIKDTLSNFSTTNGKTDETVTFDQYAVPYMWGTMGFMYDPENVTLEDVSSWDIIWDKNHKNHTSLKDSVRDTYITATLHIYKEELLLAKQTLSPEDYNERVTEIMNRCDDLTISLVETALKKAKENIYEFEVDTGKEHIINGDYYVNLCWSGDAVYAMNLAEGLEFEDDEIDENFEPFYLNYKVPEEGSNIWFDGWVMPKGANKELAQELMNFLCDPGIAAQNMEYIGYTSAMAGQDMWELVQDWYDEGEDTEEAKPYDLTYFFKDTQIVDEDGNPIEEFIIYTTEENRQLFAQYPDEETILRCAVMKDFGGQNEKVSEMWIRVKGNSASWVIFVFLGVIVVLIVLFEVRNMYNKRARKNRNKNKAK